MRRYFFFSMPIVAAIFFVIVGQAQSSVYTFADPVDAMSIGIDADTIDLAVSALIGGEWTGWQELVIEKEFDPLLRESNLVMFPKPVSVIRVRGSTKKFTIKPIRVSQEPVRVKYAARTPVSKPVILMRRQWGADDSFLYEKAGAQTSRSDVNTQSDNGNGNVSDRMKECLEAQQAHPEEFALRETIRSNGGQNYRWPQQYSKEVDLLVVHHTALEVNHDDRPAVERVRALYQYHALNRGWGDIGYHYLIDENGQIYEGRAGGRYVVGGHAYCNNIGSIGVALLGNFDMEKPTQEQMHSLQWLLDDLSQVYGVDLAKRMEFHGKAFPSPVVGHGELLSTDCPGFYVRETLAQVRSNVLSGNLAQVIRFPVIVKKTPARATQKLTAKEVRSVGSTTLSVTPGARARFTVEYASKTGDKRRTRIAQIQRSNVGIGLFQEYGGQSVRLSTALLLSQNVRAGEILPVSLVVQAPRTPGTYWIDIGNNRYTINVKRGNVSDVDMTTRRQTTTISRSTYDPQSERSLDPKRSDPNLQTTSAADVNLIRIRLTINDKPTLRFGTNGGAALSQNGSQCEAAIGDVIRSDSVLTFTADEFGTISLSDGNGTRSYRGDIECRIVNGELVIINELPLEEYLLGLAEEPDTEPFEKQRAFAIAARTYAMWYMDPANRKFPGRPYDGSDHPAEFQAYQGIAFEKNENWTRAVNGTSMQVLTKNGQFIKPPYFSSDDGRTRSPEENGWENFPFAEIFSSKPDPWCEGMPLRGHGVGMSGCGAEAQANEGKTAEQILRYYYPGTEIAEL